MAEMRTNDALVIWVRLRAAHAYAPDLELYRVVAPSEAVRGFLRRANNAIVNGPAETPEARLLWRLICGDGAGPWPVAMERVYLATGTPLEAGLDLVVYGGVWEGGRHE